MERIPFDMNNNYSKFVPTQKTALSPCKQDLVNCVCATKTFDLSKTNGIFETFGVFVKNSGIFVTSSLNRVDDRSQIQILFLKTNSHEATILAATKVEEFSLSSHQYREMF